MKKILMLTMCLALVPMLFGADIADDDPAAIPDHDARDARLAPPPTGPVQIDDSRALGDLLMTIDLTAIGVPGIGYAGAGLTWDGTYLYYGNQNDQMIYVIDPTGPSLVTTWPTGLVGPWGVGAESNIWITDYLNNNAYEYTWGGTPTGNSFYANAGGASWMGDISEWYTPGEICILAVGGTNEIYQFTVPGGAILGSIGDPAWAGISQRALTYDPHNHTFWLGGWNVGTIWEVDANTGVVLRQFDPADYAIAGLAYDWQSTLHPTPVLWLTTNASTNYIYMLDADNPQPVQGAFFDFEDGWQGWTHTNGQVFPAAWGVEPSGIHTPCPDPGDSSMWIDSDASGGGYSDSALSPLLVPNPTMDWLKYGFYNYGGSGSWINELRVGIKYFDGSTWNVVELAYYPAGATSGPAWDSVDVSAYATADLVQIYFYHDDLGTWGYYSAFDNVSIDATIYSADHDVASIEFLSPGLNVSPGLLDVIGVVANLGNFDETYDVHCVVTDPSVVLDVTLNVTTLIGETDTLNFGSVDFQDGTTYDIMMATLLTDNDPTNDTLTQTTYCTSAFWEILDPPAFPLPSAGHQQATIHDGYYYSFGMQEGGAYSDTVIVYDIANNQWLDGTTNPYGASRYGTCNAVNGKFYRLGGTAAWPTPLQRLDILDPPNTWSAGATPPNANMDQITGVYKDSLLFSFGGGQWSVPTITDVYFYDTYLDSWTTCTSFPAPGHGALAGGIIDSFAILAFGYIDASNGYSSDYVVGIIDQSNPANITWGSWTPTGLTGCRRVPSGADEFNKVLWVIGGQVTGGTGALDRTLSYDPYTDVWTDWAMPKPMSICNITPLAITTTAAGDIGVFVGGGYSSGGYVGDHEVFHTGYYESIEEMPGQETAGTFGFAPNMPNPTKGLAPITYTTTMSGKVSMNVYDNTGRLVRTLVNRAIEPAGTKTVYWNHKDNNHRDVANGIYFIRLEAEENTATHKLVLVK